MTAPDGTGHRQGHATLTACPSCSADVLAGVLVVRQRDFSLGREPVLLDSEVLPLVLGEDVLLVCLGFSPDLRCPLLLLAGDPTLRSRIPGLIDRHAHRVHTCDAVPAEWTRTALTPIELAALRRAA